MIGAPRDTRTLGLPSDLWMLIAKWLKPISLNYFTRATKLMNAAGTRPVVVNLCCEDLYARLRAIAPYLPVKKFEANSVAQYQEAFKIVDSQQKKELAYLIKHHPGVAQPILEQPLPKDATPLQLLEHQNSIIDDINIAIITPLIAPNTIALNLENLRITRLPPRLFTNPIHRDFFAKLQELNCNENKIRSLAVQHLPKLRIFSCSCNELEHLTLEDLPKLTELHCRQNRLTGKLDLSKFPKLNSINLSRNRLTGLNLTGINFQTLNCSYNELEILEITSDFIDTLFCANNQLKSIILALCDFKYATYSSGAMDAQENDEIECVNAKNKKRVHIQMGHLYGQGIDLTNNPLISISQNVIDCFGQEWALKMLGQTKLTDESDNESNESAVYSENDVDRTQATINHMMFSDSDEEDENEAEAEQEEQPEPRSPKM